MVNEVRSQKLADASELSSATAYEGYVYHEIAGENHLVRVDVLEQLKANMAQLEDLHGRLRYMMGEVGTLLKRT